MRAAPIADGLADLPPSVVQRRPELWEFIQASGLQSLVVGASKDANAKVTLLLVSPESGEAVLAVKAPTTDAAARAVGVEGRLLTDLHRLGAADVMEAVPRVRRFVGFAGRRAVVMTAVEGMPMTTSYLRRRHTARAVHVEADFDAVGTWLANFQRRTAGAPAPLEMDDGVSARLSGRFPADERLEADLDRLAEVHARLRRHAVHRSAVHGDLWMGNVLLTGGQVTGVVDWEAGSTSGEPVRDLVRFALMYALYLDRATRAGRRVAGHSGLRARGWGSGVAYALDGDGWFPELFRRFLSDGLVRLGAAGSSWRDAALAGIAEVAARTDDAEFARRHVELFRDLAHPDRG
jgi:aminoglycoside phosphotransferase (APT) family kinase protein